MPTLHNILCRLFRGPAIVIIGGTWKTGKTDFALRISELLKMYGIVTEVASNIDTENYYPQISDITSLRSWLYQTRSRKLYIFDEASEHLPNTRGMSGKSVGIKSLIPQISKAHARMIVIGHNIKKVDAEIYDETWCRAIIMKPNIPYKYTPAIIYSRLLPKPFRIAEIQPTKIKFDPYLLAPFTERAEKSVYFKDEEKNILWKWANRDPEVIGKINRGRIHYMLTKFIKANLEAEMVKS
jgi:hypothetical protein